MIDEILRYADGFDMFPGAGVLLACVSGGADSMCLLEALLEISQRRGFAVSVVHYNHMLRGDESMRDEAFVSDYCAVRGIPLFTGRGDVKTFAAQRGFGIEEAAREMRYGFFFEAAGEIGAVRIATAHTADDNAETMIFNLARGTGNAGLSGIPPTRGTVIRPMLQVSRDEVMRFIEKRGIPYVEDSTNNLDIYTRNRIRREIIPILKEINPRLNNAMAATSAISRADEEYLSRIADEYIRDNIPHKNKNKQTKCDSSPTPSHYSEFHIPPNAAIDAGELAGLPFAISSRVIRKLFGGNLSFAHVVAVLNLCKHGEPSARISLPGMTVYREYDRLFFGAERGADDEGFQTIYPAHGDCVEIPGLGLKLSCKSMVFDGIIPELGEIYLFKSIDICGKITVRSRREGDAIKLHGKDETKTLKKLFIERRIPARKRSRVPVVADDVGVLAVYGVGRGDRAVPSPGDMAVRISFEGTK